MKIMHVISGLGNGGAEAVLYRLTVADQQSGNLHHVVSLTDRGVYGDRLEQAGVYVNTMDMPRGKVSGKGLLRLYKLIRLERPDVVQTWMYHADLIGGMVSRFAGIEAIAWGIRHANLDPNQNKRKTILVARMCAVLSRWIPKKIISCSAEATRIHRELGYRPSKFIEIPNGYDMEKFKPDAEKRASLRYELGIEKNAFVVGMVARFDPLKDHQNLFFALGALKQSGHKFVCLLVGDGLNSGNSRLMGKLKDAEITAHVQLLGQRNDIAAVMNALDVHILSSSGESFPNVLAEAMACGTPCVATNVGDAALIVGDNGWMAAPADSGALAAGIRKAIALFESDRPAWQALQQDCRLHIAAHFKLEQMCERYVRAWQLCVQS